MATALADFAARSIAAGIGATALVDLWALVLRRALGLASLDWAMAGRWIGNLRRGRFAHERIAAAPAVRGERAIGWIFHYLVGIVFAAALLAAMGADWGSRPTLLACLSTGWLTIMFPWFVMQPAMGAGFAAARAPARAPCPPAEPGNPHGLRDRPVPRLRRSRAAVPISPRCLTQRPRARPTSLTGAGR